MAQKVNPITDPDGTKARAREDRARDKRAREKVKARFEVPSIPDTLSNVGDTAQTLASGVEKVVNSVRSVESAAKGIKRTFQGSSDVVSENVDQVLRRGLEIGEQYGVQQIDVRGLLGSDPYQADGNAPEMTAAEANKLKLKMQRQGNAIEVRHDKAKLGRKIISAIKEEMSLVGDLVDYHTEKIKVASKVVKNQIADTEFQSDQSKLEQTEELLIQQNIATQGTMRLTDGIRDEWDLKYERQRTKNDVLRIEIEGADMRIAKKREELESSLFSAE